MTTSNASAERIFLTAEEVGQVLHIGRSKVYDLIRSGELTSIKIGRLRRIPLDCVQEFVARLMEEARVA